MRCWVQLLLQLLNLMWASLILPPIFFNQMIQLLILFFPVRIRPPILLWSSLVTAVWADTTRTLEWADHASGVARVARTEPSRLPPVVLQHLINALTRWRVFKTLASWGILPPVWTNPTPLIGIATCALVRCLTIMLLLLLHCVLLLRFLNHLVHLSS